MFARLIKAVLLRVAPASVVVKRGPGTGGAIYLTFDDGPNPRHTPQLLDLLAEHDARATFFVIGDQIAPYGQLIGRMAADGHRIGNHSWDHPQFGKLDLREQLDQIERTDRALSGYTSESHAPFRPPRGDITLRLLLRFARAGRAMVHWSYDSMDYGRAASRGLIERLRRTPPVPGDIVLLHDDGDASFEILRELLPEWSARGLTFAALPREIA